MREHAAARCSLSGVASDRRRCGRDAAANAIYELPIKVWHDVKGSKVKSTDFFSRAARSLEDPSRVQSKVDATFGRFHFFRYQAPAYALTFSFMKRRNDLLLLLLLFALPRCAIFAPPPPPPAPAEEYPCLIFVHGRQENTNTLADWQAARNYWIKGENDFIRTATKEWKALHYVVGYDGTSAYWSPLAAGEVAEEIVRATNGDPDGSGVNRCKKYEDGGTFWVIAHSMGATIMDYILGNDYPSAANYNRGGPFDVASHRIRQVIAISGTHRGSQLADAACSESPLGDVVNVFASCNGAARSLRSSYEVQVSLFSNFPSRPVFLIGGYDGGARSEFLEGEDDDVVQYASIYACAGHPHTPYDNDNVCMNNAKQEIYNFRNVDAGDEDHDSIRWDSERDEREAVPDGYPFITPLPPGGQELESEMSAAQRIASLY